ncbi:unnamed protein product [Trichogramma brassicae]|uniref:Uncharacterized protein n=1 Tax=Trichogramma brassicae TaxID=86971 RepID=A0A6H5HUM2_9HYME|nr:unnamed protein product [Trichogramma brassicae]
MRNARENQKLRGDTPRATAASGRSVVNTRRLKESAKEITQSSKKIKPRSSITRMVKQTAREGVSAICRSPYRCEPCVRVSKRAAVDEATARGNSHESLSPFYTSVSLPHCIADLAAEQSSQIKFFCILICATEF